ncbi:prepilin-type N-terminal cleavage/methylation domain-containing protein [Clostridium beijerinckii]|uniref:prepilin-type N-terminal cleavage/methylation domain-containing protein n=1 Tax=Clostridium beijerinckii TaxID=1520 RepID=UPI001570FD81|nr:prepilin-type N-terminal cleavage/methylation domain-containing protein [Clostridium beijerinckii]NRT73596.1 type IV pilus assembly protein PilA [Clostridium beijerinckii]
MTSLSIRKMNELSKKKKKGFTLVELIIVIAIIAILAAIAIPKFGQITRDANIKADIATAKNIHGIAAEIVAEGGTVSDSTVAAKLDGSFSTLPNTKATKAKFVVDYDNSTGDITVSDGTTDIYPTLGSGYGTKS